MTTPLLSSDSSTIQLHNAIAYADAGILSQVLFKDQNCQHTLFRLAAGTEISEHTSTRNATVYVIEGNGILTLEGHNIALESGIFVLMVANTPHELHAETNLAFLLTQSEHHECKQ
jgi:quercetin dioxygenase-like cupin family protein